MKNVITEIKIMPKERLKELLKDKESIVSKQIDFLKETTKREEIDNNAKEHANNIKNFIDKRFEELRAKMPENLKNIELNNDWFGPRTAKVMLSKPIIIPRTKGDSGKFGKTLSNIVWDEFMVKPIIVPEVEEVKHAMDAIDYFVETELERLKKEKNNMNKKAFLTGDFFPLSPKGICLVSGSRGGGKTAQDWLDGLNYFVNKNDKDSKKLRKPRPDSVMIDEEHHVVVAFLNGKRYVAECKDGDKFDFRVGLGNIVSKCNDSNVELKYLRRKMKWNEYYLYCYNKFFYFNQERIKAFENSVLAEKEQYKLRFNEEKVKAYKAELNGEKYRMKKVCHNFIAI